MQIDYALILSAGLGTRMGDIGKIIPKVMWPILDKKLIDLQINYCNDLGVKKIFINTHYLADVLEKYIKDNYGNEIELLHEEPLLDSGGAIHNLAMRNDVNYKGNLLTVNGDQFLLFDRTEVGRALKELENSRAVLFGIEVDKDQNYNETIILENRLVDIVKNLKTHDYITFSGLGLIKLEGLKAALGPTKFFQTVANYKDEIVKMIIPQKIEYWDFGTAEIYYQSMANLFTKSSDKNCLFISFLNRHGVKLAEIADFVNTELVSVDLEGKRRFKEKSIIGCGKVQKIN
jgi:mannose-1-phosphate guanylyltransferase